MKVREQVGYPRVPPRTAANRRVPTVDFADGDSVPSSTACIGAQFDGSIRLMYEIDAPI
jgi:hypothetical protein